MTTANNFSHESGTFKRRHFTFERHWTALFVTKKNR